MTGIHCSKSFTTTAPHKRRLAYAALLSGVLALGVGAVGHTAIASAEFDVETYDNCMGNPHVEDSEETYHAACCLLAHGTWDQNTHKCAAIDSDRNIQGIPFGPKLGSTPLAPPASTFRGPAS